jgi:hypothetical protein
MKTPPASGHQEENYNIDGVEWCRATTPLPAFANLQYSVDCALEVVHKAIEDGMTPTEALNAAKTGWKDHSEAAKDLGKLAHDGFLAISEGKPYTVDPLVEPILKQFRSWMETEVESFIASELRVVSEKHGYAGTLDVIYRSKRGTVVLADYKTAGAFYPNYRDQVAGAYLGALIEMGYRPLIQEVKCVRFPKNGDPWEEKVYTEGDQRRALEAYRCYIRAYYLGAKRRLKNNPHVQEIWGGGR